MFAEAQRRLVGQRWRAFVFLKSESRPQSGQSPDLRSRFEQRFLKSSKFQTPSSRKATSSKHQPLSPDQNSPLELGASSFSGSWNLVFGSFSPVPHPLQNFKELGIVLFQF